VTGITLAAGLLVAAGLVGVVVPVLPGSVLVLAGIALWASERSTGAAWVVFACAVGFVLVGAAAKYAVPGRRMRRAGVPTGTLVAGGLLGIVGFFVVPVVGLPLGFVLGIQLAEWRRLGDAAAAWAATRKALRAVGLGILIELGAALLAAATWVVGVLVVG
jgi:uncharacterized protein